MAAAFCIRCTHVCSSCLQGPCPLPRRHTLPPRSSRRLKQRWMLAHVVPCPAMTVWTSWVGATTQVGGHP